MNQKTERVYIAIGSNLQPEEHIPRALMLLHEAISLIDVSRFYRSAALQRPHDPPFLNGIAAADVSIPARPLKFDVLRSVERQLGRIRTADTYAPREIDLDIALYGNAIINEPGLRVPDPDILERPFLAIPLHEIAPNLIIPGMGRRLADVVRNMDTSSITLDLEFSRKVKERIFR